MANESNKPHSPPGPTELPPTMPDLDASAPEFRPNDRIGNYRLIRIIGGGMDLVWEAEQDHPRRIVALKLLKTGPGLPARVEPEVLARLNHPNIAQVYEAGTVRVGANEVPFFAMEYIVGARTITHYAEQEKLTRRQRIELFIQVCDAVHHGHQKGFLHRDLKPDNILVDSAGRVKVIDFGIAHAVGIDLLAHGDARRSSGNDVRLLGTPQYMSPEQVRLSPDELDRRTDVYALGLVLYELLCGKPPYQVRGTTVKQITHTICDEPPEPPSKIDKGLRGDLEAILMAALAKSRDKRYASAGDFADDQRRLLNYEPVRPRSDSVFYVVGTHFRRFVAAHKIAAIFAAAALAFLIGVPVSVTIVFGSTPLNALFEGFVTSRWAARATDAFRDVRIVAISHKTNFDAIARSQGLPSIDPNDKAALRAVHERLCRKLLRSEAKVVAFDIMFGAVFPAVDEQFASAINELVENKIPVVVGSGTWRLDAQGMPPITPPIAKVARFGGVGARLGGDGAWMAPLVYEQGGEAPMRSFSLAVAAAARHPDAQIEPHIDTADSTLDLYYWRMDPNTKMRATVAPADHIPFTTIVIEAKDTPIQGLITGAVGAMFALPMPGDPALRAATYDYADVINASDAQLHEWFAGKVIVIGDEGGDGPFELPGRAPLAGFYAQATAIQMLLNGLPIRLTTLWIDFAAAFLGALVGAATAIHPWRRWLILIVLSVAGVMLSLVAYSKFHYLRNPSVGIVTMWLAAELTAWAGRARRRAYLIQ